LAIFLRNAVVAEALAVEVEGQASLAAAVEVAVSLAEEEAAFPAAAAEVFRAVVEAFPVGEVRAFVPLAAVLQA
jgi:hypothetical protein